VQKRGLAGAVRPEDGHDLNGLGAELDAEMEQASGQPDVSLQAHWRHRPRGAPRVTTLIISMTRLRAMAACGSRLSGRGNLDLVELVRLRDPCD
jgi:hypothetical protein